MQISLVSDTTHKPIVTVGYVTCFTAWAALKERIAAEHGIPAVEIEDAIRFAEDDDGIERVTVDGKPVGYIVSVIDGHTFGVPAAPALLAAE